MDRTIENPIDAKFNARAFVSAERDGYFGRFFANRDMQLRLGMTGKQLVEPIHCAEAKMLIG